MDGSPRFGGVRLPDPVSSGLSGVRFLLVVVGSVLDGGSRAFRMTEGRSIAKVPSMMDCSSVSKFTRWNFMAGTDAAVLQDSRNSWIRRST